MPIPRYIVLSLFIGFFVIVSASLVRADLTRNFDQQRGNLDIEFVIKDSKISQTGDHLQLDIVASVKNNRSREVKCAEEMSPAGSGVYRRLYLLVTDSMGTVLLFQPLAGAIPAVLNMNMTFHHDLGPSRVFQPS